MSNPFKKVKNEIKKGAKKAKQALKNQPSPKKEAQADQLKNTTEELAKEKLINADLKALVEKLGLNKAFEILKQLEDQNIELKDQLDASEVNVGLLKEEKTELEAQKKSLESEKEKLDIQNQELESKNTELQNKKEELKSESKKFISWANGMKNLYKNLKADKLKVDEEITKLKKQLEEKAAELEQITEQKAELEKQIADSKQDVSKTFAEKMLNYLDDAKSPQEVVELLKKDFIDNTKVIEFIELMSKELISDLKILLEDVTGEIADQKFKEELESKLKSFLGNDFNTESSSESVNTQTTSEENALNQQQRSTEAFETQTEATVSTNDQDVVKPLEIEIVEEEGNSELN